MLAFLNSVGILPSLNVLLMNFKMVESLKSERFMSISFVSWSKVA
jgi:hypothetical protein